MSMQTEPIERPTLTAMSEKTALIVGCHGQDGRYLFEALEQRNYRILGIAKNAVRCREISWKTPIDINHFEQVCEVIQQTQPDEIYYVAAFHHSSENHLPEPRPLFEKSYETHVSAVVNFLEAIRLHSPQSRFFYAASSHIFGHPKRHVQNEKTVISPTCIYGITKATAVFTCRFYRDQYGLFVSIGILYNHESRFKHSKFLTKKIIQNVLDIKEGKRDQLVLGNLKAKVDWGFAPDFVDAMYRILQQPQPDEFIIATGQPHTVKDFVAEAFAAMGLDWKKYVKEDPSLLSKKQRVLIGQPDKLKAQTEWQPLFDFPTMVRQILQEELAFRHKILVFIPTYNERDNVTPLAKQLMALSLNLDILFLDDHSPDGTGDILDQLALTHPNIFVIHRKGKEGIGSAHLTGVNWAYNKGYSSLITMDCDFTHRPEAIPTFIEKAKNFDIVVGSRFLQENSLEGWSPHRKFMTHVGHFMTKNFLQLPFDSKNAYRLYRLENIPRHIFNRVTSSSYSFFFESLFLLHLHGCQVGEIPITLPARAHGESKMALKDVVKSVTHLFSLYLTSRQHSAQLRQETNRSF